MDDTLTYTAASDMTKCTPPSTSPLSRQHADHHGRSGWHGHHHGDRHRYGRRDGYVKQTIMVTVEAADMTLGVPGGVMTSNATVDPGTLLVKVDWTPGNNAVGHLVMLFTEDWQGAPLVEGMPTGSSHTFTVDAGSYIAVVVAYDANANIQLWPSRASRHGGPVARARERTGRVSRHEKPLWELSSNGPE